MLIQKTLHMSQSLAECKARLASIQSYKRQFVMVTKATVTSSKTVDFSFRGPIGFEAHTVLLAVDSESPDQYTFESVGGNIDLMGLVDFAEIRPQAFRVARSAFSFYRRVHDFGAAQHPCTLRRYRGAVSRACVGAADVRTGGRLI